MFGFIYLLKALASILITNSHLGNMYPSEFMALGGSFGNGLFFFCISGFLLVNIKTILLIVGEDKKESIRLFCGSSYFVIVRVKR